MIFNVGCDLHAQKLGTQICNFKSAMFACNVCVLELVCSWPHKVHCEGLCIAIILMSGKLHITLKLLHCAVKQFLRRNISLRVSSFTRYNRANFLFFFIYGVVKKPCYNQNLAISELVNGCSFHWTTHKRKRDRELCLVKTGTTLYPSSL